MGLKALRHFLFFIAVDLIFYRPINVDMVMISKTAGIAYFVRKFRVQSQTSAVPVMPFCTSDFMNHLKIKATRNAAIGSPIVPTVSSIRSKICSPWNLKST